MAKREGPLTNRWSAHVEDEVPSPGQRLEKRTSWLAACLKAALIEGALVAFFLVGLVAPVPLFSGADNPMWFYLAGLLHLPSSLLFPVLVRPSFHGFLFACGVVAFLQFLLLVVLVKKPWRRVAG